MQDDLLSDRAGNNAIREEPFAEGGGTDTSEGDTIRAEPLTERMDSAASETNADVEEPPRQNVLLASAEEEHAATVDDNLVSAMNE